jgi:hypothetical protein
VSPVALPAVARPDRPFDHNHNEQRFAGNLLNQGHPDEALYFA